MRKQNIAGIIIIFLLLAVAVVGFTQSNPNPVKDFCELQDGKYSDEKTENGIVVPYCTINGNNIIAWYQEEGTCERSMSTN